MKIGHIMEVILYVNDMEAQVAFYHKVMGFDVSYPADLESYEDQAWVTLSTGACVLALHAGGQGRLGVDAPKIVFKVDDVAAARQYLLDKGVTMQTSREAAPGVTVCDGQDPEGNPFSIESYA